MLDNIIGIDLGTSNSCLSILEGREPVVIHNQEGGRTTPSVVSWDAEEKVLVGAPSKRQAITNPRRTVFGVKRLIGLKQMSPEAQVLAQNMPYEIVAAPNGDACVSVDERHYSPPEISAHILKKLKTVAEDYLGESVNEAIITVPAYFDDVQRQATRDAGALAGLMVRAIINEPTAAALAYGLQSQQDQRLAVFDLGGGTFDISILAIESRVFEVLSTSGDTHLGGDDFDRRLIDLLSEGFHEEHGIELREDAVAVQRLKDAVERAKIELSSAMTTDVNLPYIAAGEHGPLHLLRDVTRAELEKASEDLLDRLEEPCRKAMRAAHVTPGDIDQVLLVGGMTRMPAVQHRVAELFGSEPSKGVNPDEIVAVGAALHSGVMGGELQEVVLLDVTPHALGIRVSGDKMSVIIPENTTIPTRERKAFATTRDDQGFVEVNIYQGPSEVASENRSLGRFILGDLPKGPSGHVRVEVSFSLNTDGILEVSARELTTGKATSVTVEAASTLPHQ